MFRYTGRLTGLFSRNGFTLIELLVVVTILSILALVAVPRMSRFFSSRRENMALLTQIIAKTHDDSFLNNRINFLTIHLYNKDPDTVDEKNTIPDRRNAISVLNLRGTTFVDNERRLLQPHDFPDSFKLQEVVLRTGTVISKGSVIIPYYPQGYSDSAVIHVLINDDEKWSVKIRKHFREPEVINGWIQ